MSELSDRSYHDLHREFLAVESELDLFTLRVDDVPVWERVRRPLWVTVQNTVQDTETNPIDAGTRPPLRSRLREIGAALGPKNPFLRRSRDVLVWGHNRRQLQHDGRYWDLYCDPIYDDLDLEYLHLEIPHQGHHYKPPKTVRLAYMDIVRFGGVIQRRLGRGDHGLDPHVERRLRRAEARFQEVFGLSLDVRGRVRRRLATRRTTKPLFGALLDRHDPSLVIVVVSYGKETFIEACRERSIPVVELQHGVITRYHYGYSYPGERQKEAVPDRLLTFGEYWNETVPYPEGMTAEAVGYSFLERQYERYERETSGDSVVFISQHNHVGRPLSRLAVDLGDYTTSQTEVIYKLHPEEYESWRSRYPWLEGSDVEVVGIDGPSLYELFGRASAVTGVYSTALFEGLKFDLPVYLLREPGISYLSDLIDAGAATVVDSAAELAGELEADRTVTIETNDFFKPDPLSNIESALARYQT